jgi:hypothetical protein
MRSTFRGGLDVARLDAERARLSEHIDYRREDLSTVQLRPGAYDVVFRSRCFTTSTTSSTCWIKRQHHCVVKGSSSSTSTLAQHVSSGSTRPKTQ